MFRKTLFTLIGAATIFVSGGFQVHADDTDLYLRDDDPPPDSEPMVMFSIDYRPNLGSVVCRRGTGVGTAGETECDFLVEEGYLPEKPVGDAYDFFDLIRAAFGYVLDEVGGVRLGLMFNHDHRNNCEGPDGVEDPGCSNGGYIAMGFELIETINEINSDGTYNTDGVRNSCGPFQGSGLESNDDRDFGSCSSPGRFKALNILWDIPVSTGDRTHSYQGKELFFEFFRYLRGFDVYNGHTGFTSYDGNDGYDSTGDGIPDLLPDPLPGDAPNPSSPGNSDNEDANQWNLDADPLHVDYSDWATGNRDALYAWDPDIEEASGADWYKYKEPFGTGKCTAVYTVNMMFQVSNQEDDSDPEIKKAEDDQGMGINKRNPTFVDVIAKLREEDQSDIAGDQGVKSYFLLADPFVKNRTGGQYALAGGTGAPLLLSERPEELIANLTDIFKQILSVSTTFVAASIPVNSFNRAEVLDNVYLALFQPHPDKEPYWFGNVKKLRLAGLNTGGSVFLEDADGDPAIAADGRIRFDALTFWTNPNIYDVKDDFDTNLGEVSLKDGRSVNRGGSGHKQKGFSSGSPGASNSDTGARTVYYDDTASQLADLDATDAVAADVLANFGAADTDETKTMISWLRGQDAYDEDLDSDFTDGRRWYMASALHSRPIPINYGARGSYTKTNPEIVVAVGTNDGMMRLIRNTPVGHAGGAQTAASYGEELWAFAPRATMATTEKLTRTYRGLPSFGIQPPYGVDGAPVVYVEEDGDGTISTGEKVWLFFGLRRGGQSYYGMDISDPENPDLLWRIDAGDTGFEELAYTFSTPTVGRVKIGGTTYPVVIFGGGYDLAYDSGAPTTADGNAVFVVNAENGSLIHKFTDTNLVDSIASPVSVVDLNGDGFLDRIVVGDMGGNVWRMDMPPGATGTVDWTINRLAVLGRRDSGCPVGDTQCGQDRRFFHAPDLVPFRDASGDYDAVVIGSGNRASPLGTTTDDYMFMVKDREVSTLTAPSSGSVVPKTFDDLRDITDCTSATSTCTEGDVATGWKLGLTAGGEKSLASPVTLSGIVFFTSFLPPGSTSVDEACVPPEGEGRLYAVGLAEGNALVNRDKPIDEQDSPGEPEDRWEKLASAGIPAEVVALPPKFILRPDLTVQEYPGRQRWRTFWYKEEEPGQ